MNRQQKWVLTNFALIILITAAAVLGMIELKNWVNRSEAMRAMEQLQEAVTKYREKNGSVPPESYVDGIINNFAGKPRLGNLNYRARWITFDSPPETVLAYVNKDYNSFFTHPGVIVLHYDGRIEWMEKAKFDKLLAPQQTKLELEMTPQNRF
jgi:type II secretory pathway pseudopilin PulG